MAWQRATRRYSDDQLWNLHNSTAELIVASTEKMLKWKHGYPAEFSPEFEEELGGGGWLKWEAILTEIRDGFQAWLDVDGYFDPHQEEQRKKYERAKELFAEWHSALWD